MIFEYLSRLMLRGVTGLDSKSEEVKLHRRTVSLEIDTIEIEEKLSHTASHRSIQ